MENPIEITIAVCTYRRFNWLAECLEALKKQTVPQSTYRIVVVDNSLQPDQSTAFRDSLEGFPNLHYLITENAGLSFARNVALEECETPYLAYIDDDALAAPNWVEEIIKTFPRYPGAGVLGGRVRPIWEETVPEWLQGDLLNQLGALDWGDQEILGIDESKWLVGANLAYRVPALRKCGGFPVWLGRKGTLLFAHEELAVNNALQKMGYDILYAPSVVVDHSVQPERMTKTWLYRQAFWGGASRILLDLGINDVDLEFLSSHLEKSFPEFQRKYAAPETPESILGALRDVDGAGQRECLRVLGRKATAKLQQSAKGWPVFYFVTPSFNAANTINQTIMSVVTQAGHFAIRYHVQDGGSTDGTLEKLKDWRKRLEEPDSPLIQCRNVVFTHASEPDGGMYEAITRGFGAMHIPPEAFMGWVNTDDLLIQNLFQTVLKISEDLPHVEWIGGIVSCIGEDGHVIANQPEGFPREALSAGACDGIHWQALQQEGTLFKKCLWDKVAGLNLKLKYAADWDLWRRFAQHSDFVQAFWPWGSFRKRAGQLSAVEGGRRYRKEVNTVVSAGTRRKTVMLLAKRGRNAVSTPVLVPDFDSERYSIRVEPIGYHVSHQAEEHFRDFEARSKTAEQREMPAPGHAHSLFSISQVPKTKRRFYDILIFHRMYLALPFWYQELLTRIKYGFLLPLLQYPGTWRMRRSIIKSGLFLKNYYLKCYSDVAESGMDPVVHYIREGSGEGHSPNPFFCSRWYLEQYRDVAAAGMNPLYHYIKLGAKEGRDPGPGFSTNGYLEANPDVRETNTNPLRHYLLYGLIEEHRLSL